jgi:apolipoprotein N-acyltransferase
MQRPNQSASDACVQFLETFRTRSLPWRRHPVLSMSLWCRAFLWRPPLISGLLLWLSFPPIGLSFLAWFALVPLALLIRATWKSNGEAMGDAATSRTAAPEPRRQAAKPLYRPAWFGGLVFGLLAVHWIHYADDTGLTGYYGWWALGTYMSLYFPAFLLIARIAVLRFRMPGVLAVPTVWVGLEYLRSWLISGFPWYYLGHTQYQWIRLIQVSDFCGAYGVGFLVALVNGWILDLGIVPLVRPTAGGGRLEPRQVWRLALLLAALGGSLMYGKWRLGETEQVPGPRVAIIQSSIMQKVKEDEERIPEIHLEYWKQIPEAVAQHPDMVIWPETAYRYPLATIASDVTDDDLRRLIRNDEVEPAEIREFARRVRKDLMTYAARAGVPILMGINTEFFKQSGSQRFNSAFLVSPHGELSEPYNKIHLVPWGEYLPLRDWLPWLRIFTPHASADYGLQAGTSPVRFSLGDWTFGVLICFEDTQPWAARAYVRDDPVDFLVNISNDGWFGVVQPAEAEASLWRRAQHEAHLAISVFRAVECRRPLVRSVNTGISAVIDSAGRIVESSASTPGKSKLAARVIVAQVPLDRRRSLYSQTGDWLGATAFAVTMAMLVVRLLLALWSRVRPAAIRR